MGVSHQPAFMSSCLTISHTCLPCYLVEECFYLMKPIYRWEGGEVARRERWENSEVARLERWDGKEEARWQSWESSEVARWEVPGFIWGGGRWVSPGFHLFVSDVNQWNEGAGCVQGMERFSLDLMQAVNNVAGCESDFFSCVGTKDGPAGGSDWKS